MINLSSLSCLRIDVLQYPEPDVGDTPVFGALCEGITKLTQLTELWWAVGVYPMPPRWHSRSHACGGCACWALGRSRTRRLTLSFRCFPSCHWPSYIWILREAVLIGAWGGSCGASSTCACWRSESVSLRSLSIN